MINLRILQLSSPNLPVGGFSYSQGLETAIEKEWIKNNHDLAEWIKAQLRHNLRATDLPLMQRLYHAWQNDQREKIVYWNHMVFACRESQELYAQEVTMGKALARLLCDLGFANEDLDLLIQQPSYIALYSLAGVRWDIDLSELQQSFLWSWMENQVMAAIKLFPIGQTQGQIILSELSQEFREVIGHAQNIGDAQIGISLPAVVQACALHEVQYSRLFRS